MGSGRCLCVALGTAILVLLGCGVLTLGFSKAGHAVVAQHMAAEAQAHADVSARPSGAVVEAHERRTEHGRAHLEHGLHLLGACAAVLAAGLGLLLRRRAGADRTATSTPLAEDRSSWSTVAAPRGLGPPARLSLCVQLC
jgi:hypothetical protein